MKRFRWPPVLTFWLSIILAVSMIVYGFARLAASERSADVDLVDGRTIRVEHWWFSKANGVLCVQGDSGATACYSPSQWRRLVEVRP